MFIFKISHSKLHLLLTNSFYTYTLSPLFTDILYINDKVFFGNFFYLILNFFWVYFFNFTIRVPLRRGMAFSSSIKYPPLLKTRNITSQNSINWHQIPATPTPTSPQSQHTSPSRQALVPTPDTVSVTSNSSSNPAVNTLTETEAMGGGTSKLMVQSQSQPQQQTQQQQVSAANQIILSTQLSNSTETDV